MPCVWLKKLQGLWQIARLKQQRYLSFTFYKTQRSYEKTMCICHFIDSVVEIVLYLHFLYTKQRYSWKNVIIFEIMKNENNTNTSSFDTFNRLLLKPGPGPWKSWTEKSLDPEKPGLRKIWTLKILNYEKRRKQLDAEKKLEDHMV